MQLLQLTKTSWTPATLAVPKETHLGTNTHSRLMNDVQAAVVLRLKQWYVEQLLFVYRIF